MVLGLTAPAAADTIIIDDFSSTSNLGPGSLSLWTAGSSSGVTDPTAGSLAGILGGQRFAGLSFDAGAGNVMFFIAGGTGEYASTSQADGGLALLYPNTNNTDFTGTTGLTLEGFTFDFANGTPMTIYGGFLDADGTLAYGSVTVTGAVNNTDETFALSGFTNVGDLDLAHIVGVGFVFDAQVGHDFSLTGISANLDTPEPGTLVVWGLAGAACAWAARRRRLVAPAV
jgi:hypothetical protein